MTRARRGSPRVVGRAHEGDLVRELARPARLACHPHRGRRRADAAGHGSGRASSRDGHAVDVRALADPRFRRRADPAPCERDLSSSADRSSATVETSSSLPRASMRFAPSSTTRPRATSSGASCARARGARRSPRLDELAQLLLDAGLDPRSPGCVPSGRARRQVSGAPDQLRRAAIGTSSVRACAPSSEQRREELEPVGDRRVRRLRLGRWPIYVSAGSRVTPARCAFRRRIAFVCSCETRTP